MPFKITALIFLAILIHSCTSAQQERKKFSGVWIQIGEKDSSIPPDTLIIKSTSENDFTILHKNVVKTIKRNERREGWQVKVKEYPAVYNSESHSISAELFDIYFNSETDKISIEGNEYFRSADNP